jgi:hypothetical protein
MFNICSRWYTKLGEKNPAALNITKVLQLQITKINGKSMEMWHQWLRMEIKWRINENQWQQNGKMKWQVTMNSTEINGIFLDFLVIFCEK